MNNYFDSRIGSSLPGDCIVSAEPLAVCTDLATKERKPTPAMEMGRMFEDLVQSEYDPDFDFWEKYFKSDVKTFPSTTAKGIKNILDMFEDEHEFKDENGVVLNSLHQDIVAGYIYKKPDKNGNRELNATYLNRHRLLDQIIAHDYRRPIPKPWWKNLEIMLERFKNYPLELAFDDYGEYTMPIAEWMEMAEVLWQVEFFWEEDGAECRAKFDMIWLIKFAGDSKIYAVPLDLKCTGDDVEGNSSFGAFVRNWKTKYIWQSEHYYEGFLKWCDRKSYFAYDRIPYIIQESEEPQLTHVWELSPEELRNLKPAWREALTIIQKWIDDGKPVKGYMPQKTVNRWGKE